MKRKAKKKCEACAHHALKALEHAVQVEKLEIENKKLDEKFWELYAVKEAQFSEGIRAMLDVMAKGLSSASNQFEIADSRWASLLGERKEWEKFLADLQLVQVGCTREIGGSVWVRGEQIAECLNRYTNGR